MDLRSTCKHKEKERRQGNVIDPRKESSNAVYNAADNLKAAGRRNVMSQLEREAKELAFGMPVKAVDEVFGSQQESYFFKGPRQQQHKGRDEM